MFISKDIFYKISVVHTFARPCNKLFLQIKELPRNITLRAVSIIVYITYTYDLFYIKRCNKYSIFH